MGNGQCERFNRTLLGMLGTLEPHQKSNWKDYVTPMVHAYNCTRNETTGVAPYFLMLGRQPRLPLELAFGLQKDTKKQPTGKYIQDLRDRLSHAYRLAAESAREAQARQNEGYFLKVRRAVIQKGDRVKRVSFDGKHKLADTWKDTPYIILEQSNTDIPVYTVIREDGEGRVKTLHRNLLLPVGYIRDQEQSPIEKPKPKPRPRTGNQKIPVVVPSTQDDSDDDTESNEESEVGFVLNLDSESTFTEDKDVDTRELTVKDVSMPTGDAQIHNVDTVEVQQRSTSTEQAEDISSDEEISFQNEEVLQHA